LRGAYWQLAPSTDADGREVEIVSAALSSGIVRMRKFRLEKAQVATISGHKDTAMGDLAADAMEKGGRGRRDHGGGVENALSVASVLLLTEATLTEVPEPKEEHPHPPMD
jgi:chaperonin GroEL (HSP60 family)